jgi:DNA-binding NarL/FixJ family response regulator
MCSNRVPTTTSSTPAAPPCAATHSSIPRPCTSWSATSSRAERRGDDFDVLTPRELEVLKLIAEGHSSKEIAALLVISIKTVDRHRTNMLGKLGMRDRVELTRYAIRRGLIEA